MNTSLLVRSIDGRIIGKVDSGVFTKTNVHSSAHMLRTPRAWGIDREAFKCDIEGKCHTIVIPDLDTNITYKVSVATFLNKCKYIDRGYGGQLILPLKYWMTYLSYQGELI